MTEIAIKVQSLSKWYRLGASQQHHDMLRDALMSGLRKPLELFRRNGQMPDRTGEKTIWALRNVSFEVNQGEVVGIIGRNGAGKSTLLKVLSRITEPTQGRAEIYGRLGSLLEVGTGFHPELSGRENIFLSGAILGMRKSEIYRKFNEIVAFSEIDKFLDTPVKRYSSGMYVRLAFAVAAHLNPDILLVDEVLAVGDVAFQKKCLGKMDTVASEGRTVLFVSHNMAAVRNLCPRSLLLDRGQILADGSTQEVIDIYLKSIEDRANVALLERKDRRGDGQIMFSLIELFDENYNPVSYAISGKKLIIRLHYQTKNGAAFRHCRVSVSVHSHGKVYFLASTELVRNQELVLEGRGYLDCVIDELPLSKGEYYLNPFVESNFIVQDLVEAAVSLSVVDGNFYGTGRDYPPRWEGKTVLVKHHWDW